VISVFESCANAMEADSNAKHRISALLIHSYLWAE
jgi:hypothetical protein